MGGTTRLGYTDVLVVREIDCGNWLAREYTPAYQHCGLFFWFESTQLARQLQQERTQMEVQYKEARKRLA